MVGSTYNDAKRIKRPKFEDYAAPQPHPGMMPLHPQPRMAPPQPPQIPDEVEIYNGPIHPSCCCCFPAPASCSVHWEVTTRRVDYKRPLCCCCGTQASTALVRNIKDVDYKSCCGHGVVTVTMSNPKETLFVDGCCEGPNLKKIYAGLKKAAADLKVALISNVT